MTDRLPDDPPTDSSGVPWEGRRFEQNPFAADDGAADPRLSDAISEFRGGRAPQNAVVDAVRNARLLVPLVASLGETGAGVGGRTTDKSAELSLVTVAGPDGRDVLPAFTSADAMRRWNPEARPVPVDAVRVALAAVSESTELVVLDPTAATEFAIRRPALWAIAQQQQWSPPADDVAVIDEFAVSVAVEPAVVTAEVSSGDPDSRLIAPELLVTLTVAPGLDQAALADLLQRLRSAWAHSAVIVERVDSLAVKLLPARAS